LTALTRLSKALCVSNKHRPRLVWATQSVRTKQVKEEGKAQDLADTNSTVLAVPERPDFHFKGREGAGGGRLPVCITGRNGK